VNHYATVTKIIPTPRGKFRVGGRRTPKFRPHAIRLNRLMRKAIALPPSTNRRAKADRSLRDIALNDLLGDCVIAARAHRIGLLTGYASGTSYLYTRDQILAEYKRIGGYDGTPATDNGCDMATAANDGVNVGYADGSKDVGWIAIDPTNKTEVMTAIYLFEVGDVGCALPDAWISPFPSADNFVWDVAGPPDFQNGHCYEIIDYTTNGVVIATWGLEGIETFEALAKYGTTDAGGELYIHLNQDQLDKAMQRSPDGVAWGDLIAAFNSMGGLSLQRRRRVRPRRRCRARA